MPFPRFVAKSNRYLLNPIVRLFAGRIPPFATLIHRGRTSGAEYRTPIMAFPASNGFVIALTYGRNTDWERNVLAAGGCVLIYRGKRHDLTNPHFIDAEEAGPAMPGLVRRILRLNRVNQYVQLDLAR